jgi:hypothetical protein
MRDGGARGHNGSHKKRRARKTVEVRGNWEWRLTSYEPQVRSYHARRRPARSSRCVRRDPVRPICVTVSRLIICTTARCEPSGGCAIGLTGRGVKVLGGRGLVLELEAVVRFSDQMEQPSLEQQGVAAALRRGLLDAIRPLNTCVGQRNPKACAVCRKRGRMQRWDAIQGVRLTALRQVGRGV